MINFTKLVDNLDGGEIVEYLIWTGELANSVIEGKLLRSDLRSGFLGVK